jgi:hypothetical protein
LPAGRPAGPTGYQKLIVVLANPPWIPSRLLRDKLFVKGDEPWCGTGSRTEYVLLLKACLADRQGGVSPGARRVRVPSAPQKGDKFVSLFCFMDYFVHIIQSEHLVKNMTVLVTFWLSLAKQEGKIFNWESRFLAFFQTGNFFYFFDFVQLLV